jgi:CHAT domain-containing protein/lipopolysaccharide biosynthesis regulator YciM
MRRRPTVVVSVVVFLFLVVLSAVPAPADPVVAFIVRADSLAKAGGDDALRPFVADEAALVGAAVWQLLDIAFQVGEAGDKSGENENVDFAERVARIHEAQSGSAVPLGLVETYRAWTPADRQSRTEAKTLHDQADELRGSEPGRAAELYNQALPIYEQIDDRHSIAVVWGGLGVAHWYLGDMDAVKENYKKALAARRAVEDRILEGRTLNGLGSVHMRQGDFGAAIDYYNQAIDVRRRTGDIAGLGTSMTYLGHVYFQSNRLVDARDQYEQALPILEAQGKEAALVDVLNGIANCYGAMGRYERAIETYRRAIAAAQAAGDPQKEILHRANLAETYRVAGRFAAALAELDTVATGLERNPDTQSEARLRQIRGSTYLDTGQYDLSRDDMLKCVELAGVLEDPGFQVESLRNVGYLYSRLGAYDRGLAVAGQAKAVSEEHGLARQYREAMALMGELYRFKGDYAKSLEHWQEALAQDEHDQVAGSVLLDRIAIAGVVAAAGDTQEARRQLYGIAPQDRAEGGEVLETGILFAFGHTFETENPDSAAHYYEAALTLIEQSRASLSADEARSSFVSGERRRFYEEVARYYATLDDGAGGEWSERAFTTVERAKARGLLDLLVLNESSRTTAAEEDVLDKMYGLDPDAADYESQRGSLQAEYDRLRDTRLEEAVGALADAAAVARIKDVQKKLPKGVVVLQYALGDTTSLLWAIDRKGYDLVTIPNRSALRPDVEQLRDAIAQPGAGDAALKRSSRALYEKLIAPAGGRLDKAEQLVIIPDGFLHEVPFDVLVTDDADPDAGWESQPFLAREHATVYAPSATIFVKLHAHKKRKYDLDLVAYGDPDFALLGDGASFEPLPHAREEIAAIGENVEDSKQEVRLGADANEAALKQQLNGGSSRVYHFATHGLVNPVEPAASCVVLCPDPAHVEDGYLNTLEILSMTTNGGMVVVSACETALGRVSRGEGVVGLSRAFVASGAGGVVASLWAVSDESTSELMKVFYEKMLGNKRPAGRALRDARLALIEDERYSHPFYWSPFIVIGTDKSPW